jgi:hypothetical protein
LRKVEDAKWRGTEAARGERSHRCKALHILIGIAPASLSTRDGHPRKTKASLPSRHSPSESLRGDPKSGVRNDLVIKDSIAANRRGQTQWQLDTAFLGVAKSLISGAPLRTKLRTLMLLKLPCNADPLRPRPRPISQLGAIERDYSAGHKRACGSIEVWVGSDWPTPAFERMADSGQTSRQSLNGAYERTFMQQQ